MGTEQWEMLLPHYPFHVAGSSLPYQPSPLSASALSFLWRRGSVSDWLDLGNKPVNSWPFIFPFSI